MPSIEDVQTELLRGVQEIRTTPGIAPNEPFVAGYWQACNDLTMLLSDSDAFKNPALVPGDALERVRTLCDSLRQHVEQAPPKAMAAGASGAHA